MSAESSKLDIERSVAGRAVFLSYASQDAEAAKRIADALRAAGVEVWFDAAGGLEHGDEWDAKIRRQIKECVLFVPIISANTQAREEGYFRIEWDLAAERARGIASGVAFILPVVIDGTKEQEALVPDRFRAVQWTKLPGGVVPAEVLQRFLKLWSHRTGALKHASAEQVGASLDGARGQSSAPGWKIYAGLAVVCLALGAGVVAWLSRHDNPTRVTTAANPRLEAPKEKEGDKPAAAPAPALAVSAVVLQGREMLEKFVTDDTQRETLGLAEDLAKRALQENPADADAWSLSAQVSSSLYVSGRDHLPARLSAMNAAAERAMQLAPKSDEALYARAVAYRLQGATSAEAERLLRELVQRNPTDRRMLRMLGNALRNRNALAEALAAYRQAAALPGGDARAELACAETLDKLGRHDEAAAAAERSLALQPTGSAYLFKVNLARVRGDLAAARAELAKVPPAILLDVRGASVAANVWLWSREPEKMIAVLNAVPGDDLYNSYFYGPKSLLLGFAHQLAGRNEVAKLQWRVALRNLEQRAEADPFVAMEPLFMGLRMFLGFLIEDPAMKTEARQMLRLYLQLGTPVEIDPTWDMTKLFSLLGMQDTIIDFCEEMLSSGDWPGLREIMRTRRDFAPLRGNPRFDALLKEPEAKK